MPSVGFGTYKFKGAGAAQRAVTEALKAGYRLIDTAFVYGGEKTEAEVGRALASSSCPVPRSEVFVVTKHWRSYHGYDATLECLGLSLKRLGVSYVDLYLMHWPGPAYHTMGRSKAVMEAAPEGPFVYARKGHERENLKTLRAETWRAMEAALKGGQVRSIGVSNFTVKHLEALKQTATVWPPAVNQVECHPYAPQEDLREYCAREGIALVAYGSLGGQDAGQSSLRTLGGSLLGRPEVIRLAEKHATTPAGVLLKWALQRGIGVLPKSSSPARMRDNLAACQAPWVLDEEDLELLGSLDQSGSEASRLCWARDPLKHLDFD